MTLDILRGLGTVLALCAFIGISAWAYSSKRKADFDAAANLPFADEPPAHNPTADRLEERRS